ncbi:MAG TPA: hypothetical protein VFK84_20000 [Burkholderiales bacterium]|nr:hypothetical protein [Burkholderiales bacterium]
MLASPKYAFKEALIHTAPEETGVYALYFGADILYVGSARGRGVNNPESLRGRLLAHLFGELKPDVATHYRWQIHAAPDVRLAEILDALGADRPPYNNGTART